MNSIRTSQDPAAEERDEDLELELFGHADKVLDLILKLLVKLFMLCFLLGSCKNYSLRSKRLLWKSLSQMQKLSQRLSNIFKFSQLTH